MSWLPKYFRSGLRAIASLGNLLPFRDTLNFIGSGVTVTDDATNDLTVVNIAGGGGGVGIDVTQPPYNVNGDFTIVRSNAYTVGGAHLASCAAPGTFPSSATGKQAHIFNGNFPSGDYRGTILSVDSDGSGVTLSSAPSFSGSLTPFILSYFTENTTAIQNAINAAQPIGQTLFFPPGGYGCAGSLTWPDGVGLEGASRGSGQQYRSGSYLVYSGNATFITMQSTASPVSNEPLDNPWRNIRLTTCASDSQVCVHIIDGFGVGWDHVTIYGTIAVGAASGPSGFTDAGIKLTSTAFGNAFQTYVDCKAAFCAGDGLQITANSFGISWIGGGFTSCGGYGIHSKNPGSGATANIQIQGADFEGCALGGFGGYGDVVSIRGGNYIEQSGPIGSGGPLVTFPAGAYCKVLRVEDTYIAKFGGGKYAIDARSAGGIHTIICRGNELPNPTATLLPGTCTVTNGSNSVSFSSPQTLPAWATISFGAESGISYGLTGAVSGTTATLTAKYTGTNSSTSTATADPGRALIACGGASNVEIGPNYCAALAPVDITDHMQRSVWAGEDRYTQTAVLNSVAHSMGGGTPAANVTWDNAGQVTQLILARPGGVVGVRAWLTKPPTTGHWQVRVLAGAPDPTAPATGTPWQITNEFAGASGANQIETAAPNCLQTGTEVVITGGLASAVGDQTATVLDAQHFSIATTVTGTYSGGGSITAIVRDTGTIVAPTAIAETFQSASGLNTFTVEEQRLPAGTTAIGVCVTTNSDFAVPTGTALVIEVTIGLLGHNVKSTEEAS